MREWIRRRAAVVVASCGILTGSVGAVSAQETPAPHVQVQVHAIVLGGHWIGVATSPIDETLRSQLGLKDNEGLAVSHVAPKSPAAEAGLEHHDVLTSVNGKTLHSTAELVHAVQEAKDKPLKFELRRASKKKTIEVQPAKRPEHLQHPPRIDIRTAVPENMPELRKWLEKLGADNSARALRFQRIGPGALVAKAGPMPKNLNVTINKSGDQPARIVVKRDDETWTITEKELDKLPKDVRPHVERMLRGHGVALGITAISPPTKGGPQTPRFQFVPRARPKPPSVQPPRVQPPRPRKPAPAQSPEVQRQLDELRKTVEALRKETSRRNAEHEAVMKSIKKLLEDKKN
ncbi:MAG: PDZ domain-containing protein [Planctomycetales bacterium]